ncbi:pyrokinin-1 receptor-like [Arctopsyche grandis]|uniref:pyrokinin-1 receptor-like n=1 Tax=Arctopsyche grandis TaxID=121162 RepID=UPI00406D9AD1
MESHNLSDFASLYFGSMFPLHFNTNLDYDTFQKLNSTVHTLFNNGELYDVLFRNNRSAPDRDELYIVIPITALYILIFLAGIVGNVSTCTVIVRNKSMHTATNYYLFSLAISDLLLLLSGLPTDVYRMWYPDVYIFGEAACRLLSLSSETSANATVLTITAFTIERYIAICHPFLSHTMSKLSRVVKFIIAIWVVALCLAVPQVIQFGVVYSRENGRLVSSCTVKETIMEHAFEISGFVFFVGPMTAITVLYVLIGIKLKRSRLLRPPKTPSQSSQQEQNGSAKSYKNGVSQSRAIKMLVAVAVSFFICWAPFHAQRLLAVYGKNTDEPSHLLMQVYKVLTYLSGVLYFLSTTINPFLYSIMSNKFREAFKVRVLCKLIRFHQKASRAPLPKLCCEFLTTGSICRGGLINDRFSRNGEKDTLSTVINS